MFSFNVKFACCYVLFFVCFCVFAVATNEGVPYKVFLSVYLTVVMRRLNVQKCQSSGFLMFFRLVVRVGTS